MIWADRVGLGIAVLVGVPALVFWLFAADKVEASQIFAFALCAFAGFGWLVCRVIDFVCTGRIRRDALS